MLLLLLLPLLPLTRRAVNAAEAHARWPIALQQRAQQEAGLLGSAHPQLHHHGAPGDVAHNVGRVLLQQAALRGKGVVLWEPGYLRGQRVGQYLHWCAQAWPMGGRVVASCLCKEVLPLFQRLLPHPDPTCSYSLLPASS